MLRFAFAVRPCGALAAILPVVKPGVQSCKFMKLMLCPKLNVMRKAVKQEFFTTPGIIAPFACDPVCCYAKKFPFSFLLAPPLPLFQKPQDHLIQHLIFPLVIIILSCLFPLFLLSIPFQQVNCFLDRVLSRRVVR